MDLWTDLSGLGERTVTLDCDVIQADGGTRTAAISGAYVALVIAMQRACSDNNGKTSPIHGMIGAISVGIYRGTPVLDLDYAEDSEAETDMNIVMNEAGRFIEVQGTAEGHAFDRKELDALISLAGSGIKKVIEKIERHNNALGGISRLTFQMNVAALPHTKLLKSIELIGNEVAPSLRNS